MRRGDLRERADVNYSATTSKIDRLYSQAKYPLTPIQDLIIRLQYGTSSLASENKIGLPVLRMSNLQDDGWDLSSLKYIDLPEAEASTYLLDSGDLLFNRTNSKELVGKCAVFRESGQWLFASYLIRVSLDRAKALPDFVSDFLTTAAGRMQIDRISRQIVGMSNINAEEIKQLILPIPPLPVQRELVAAMQSARARRAAQLQAADAELAGIDAFLLEQLGLTPPPSDIRTVFALRLKDLRESRMDVLSHRPIYSDNYTPSVALVPLKEIAFIDSNVATPPADDSELVPYVGLPECSQTEVREVVTRPYREVKGRSIVKPGNILFARIEPSVFNKKYVLVEGLQEHDFAYTSTEFYVVEPDTNKINPYYLYCLFFCSFVFAQARGKTTGSSGRRRLDPAMFANLEVPLPARELQDKIAEELRRRQETAKVLRAAAEEGWEAAKAEFERRLLGTKEGE